MSDQSLWQRVNIELAAKIIGECSYEECLHPDALEGGQYRLHLASGVTYTFSARATVWTWLRVDRQSLRRDGAVVESAVQLLIDAQNELGCSDITLAVLIEEIQNTLYSEVQRQRALEHYSAAELVVMPGPQLQALLDGHPKALANKGRMGWGATDLKRYAPESAVGFQLHFIAVRRVRVQQALAKNISEKMLMEQCLDKTAQRELEQRMGAAGLSLSDYVLMPVHPWQWQQFVISQYAEWLADGTLVDLGELGDRYLPQQSIRTLSNISRPDRCDVKLPLTILNTSCYRGVPGKTIEAGVAVAAWLREIIASDPLLSDRQLSVQADLSGLHCQHPRQRQLAGSPYRYAEMLGAVWRDSLESLLAPGERGVLMSTLMQTDANGRALVCEYVNASGIGAAQWLRELFDAVVVPLYHLMCAYGVGLVAHGQNISLILRDSRPQRAVLKDFHGDLRLVDREFPQLSSLPAKTRAALAHLPPEYLLHDLVTGHFVTTLRFVSPLFDEQLGLPEIMFYRILADSLQDYMAAHPALRERQRLFPLFTARLHKVCINRVRFRIGYEDCAERPLPELGTPIANPLCMGEQRV